MSMISYRIAAISVVAASVGAFLLPTQTAAHTTHRHSVARAHSAPMPAFGYAAPPVFFRAPPPPIAPAYGAGADCDVARDWNC